MRPSIPITRIIVVYSLTRFLRGAAIPEYDLMQGLGLNDTRRIVDGIPIDMGDHQILKRSPLPQYSHTPGDSKDNSFEEADTRGDRRSGDPEDDGESYGSWGMLQNASPNTRTDLRTHTDLIEFVNPPQDLALNLNAQALQNTGQGLPGTYVTENTALDNPPRTNENGSDSGAEEEEKQSLNVDEEEKKEASESSNEDVPEDSQSHGGYLYGDGQERIVSQNVGGVTLAPGNSGGRSRSSPSRVSRRLSDIFGSVNTPTVRNTPTRNRLYRANINRRQSFSSPFDALGVGRRSYLGRSGSLEGPSIQQIGSNFGHSEPYAYANSVQQLNEARDFIRTGTSSPSVGDDISLHLAPLDQSQQGNGQRSQGLTLVDVTGGLGEQRIYRPDEEVKEEGNTDSSDAESA